MKAIKCKINWVIPADVENRNEVLASLPKVTGFFANDEFNTAIRVPVVFKKKYGYDVKDFSFLEYAVIDKFETLVNYCRPEEFRVARQLFLKNGKLSDYGTRCFDNLKKMIEKKKRLDKKSIDEMDMPITLDTIMIACEKILNINWDATSAEDIIAELESIVKSYEKEDDIKPAKKTKNNVKTSAPVAEDEETEE